MEKTLVQEAGCEVKGIIGAIIGDIVGSRFEFYNCKRTTFKLFTYESCFTDDTVMTVAIADWLLNGRDLVDSMREWGHNNPHRGYGGMFRRWLHADNPQPYNSYGNGSGMRVSPVGFYAHSLEEALDLAKKSAEVTHNHPEGIKGAQAIASAIYLARTGKDKEEIRDYIEQTFGYDLHRDCDEIRPNYYFNETCQGSCPEAIIAFLDSWDYESAIRLAVSLGGDSDTIACMAGGIAAAYYGVPGHIVRKAIAYLPDDMLDIVREFDGWDIVPDDRKRFTPERITMLAPGEVFVFGSNLKGFHGGGAARAAMQKFGAKWGQGVGLQGQSYAIPTMQGGVDTIKPYVDEFIAFVQEHPELTFLVTRIGCGIAGFTDDEIAPLFREALHIENIVLPLSFVECLEKGM